MQLFYQFQCSLVPDRNCWLLNSSLPNLLVIMSCLTESSKKNRWTWFWDISARNLPYLTPVLLVLLFWNNSHNLHDKLLESLSTLDLQKLLQVSMNGPSVHWDVPKIHSSHKKMNSPGWSTLAVVAFMCYRVPCEQDCWKQIGKSTKFYMQCGNYSMYHLQGDILISGKLGCDIFP